MPKSTPKWDKWDFRMNAGKAGLSENLYGVTIKGPLYTNDGDVYNAKVVGIEWRTGWIHEETYCPSFGGMVDATHSGPVPYVVLKKGKETYYAEADRLSDYIKKLEQRYIENLIKSEKAL